MLTVWQCPTPVPGKVRSDDDQEGDREEDRRLNGGGLSVTGSAATILRPARESDGFYRSRRRRLWCD